MNEREQTYEVTYKGEVYRLLTKWVDGKFDLVVEKRVGTDWVREDEVPVAVEEKLPPMVFARDEKLYGDFDPDVGF